MKYKILLGISFFCLVISALLIFTGKNVDGLLVVISFATLAIGIRGINKFKGFAYTIWIFAAVALAMFYPSHFIEFQGIKLSLLITPLLQIIMFGMGTALSIKDFSAVVKTPKAVVLGLTCQFTIMPLLSFAITSAFAFPPEIAAGVILVGCSPSGLASNVMAYLAKANLALSVTLTSVATIMAPLATPSLMTILAGQYVPVSFIDMMWSITKIVILPIAAGLVFNRLLHGKVRWLDNVMPVISMAAIAFIIVIITAAGRDNLLAIGIMLIVAGALLNLSGYFFGYWSCRLFKMDERSCRTIALEVGMQNSGLASGIALEMGKIATVGLAPAVFGPLMNITGSSLATWWGGKPIKEGALSIDKKENLSTQIPVEERKGERL